MDINFWISAVALTVAALGIIAPITKTKLDDKVRDFLVETVQPLINQKADEVKAELTKQVTAVEQKKPPTGAAANDAV